MYAAHSCTSTRRRSKRSVRRWRINQESDNAHLAPFPMELVTRCIESVGEEPVLDPFTGSGTTATACENFGLPWTGIEKSAAYVGMGKNAYCTLGLRPVARPQASNRQDSPMPTVVDSGATIEGSTAANISAKYAEVIAGTIGCTTVARQIVRHIRGGSALAKDTSHAFFSMCDKFSFKFGSFGKDYAFKNHGLFSLAIEQQIDSPDRAAAYPPMGPRNPRVIACNRVLSVVPAVFVSRMPQWFSQKHRMGDN